MTTLLEMIDEVSMNLAGYTLTQDRATHLTAAVANTASTIDVPIILAVADTANLGKGAIEIDEEIMWVDQYDKVGNTATIPPYGRGYLGTTRAAHVAGAKVTLSPTFPRFAIKRAINDTVKAVGSNLYGAFSTTITASGSTVAYRFPSSGSTVNARNILSVSQELIGSTAEWMPIRRYRLDQTANSTSFTSGQTLSIYDNVTPGRTINVVYSSDPTPFTTVINATLTTLDLVNAQVFETVTGLPESCKDVIILGATYRLLANLDPARSGMTSPQADETDSKRPYGSSQSATKQVFALYNQRLSEEVKGLQDRYPIRAHYTI